MADDDHRQRPYSVFVSYARLDDGGGWVTELVAALRREFEASGARKFRVFFDRSNISIFEEWRDKLSHTLRQTPVVLACTSGKYFKSGPCLWEFREYRGRQGPHRPLQLAGESIETEFTVPEGVRRRIWCPLPARPGGRRCAVATAPSGHR
ncbi:MAG: toll/interleukin-1 receptor domain-containing protein [Propionibacteriaceae bacterium]|nr:toll/interleukin-1 receptor domain-containing protein [Propionibacteriaceae bacterium]